jgi:hypothetical protein
LTNREKRVIITLQNKKKEGKQMYKCNNCGHVFDEPKRWSESRGEFWGSPCYEDMDGCPNCEESYDEAYECKICGEYFTEEELHGGVCGGCIKEHGDFDVCYSIGENHPEQIKINGLLTFFFTEGEIESILKGILVERGLTDCSEYINDDIDWFGEELIKEVIG